MKIELKNIKYFASGSQETNCFTADLWVDNAKIAYCENDGHGGETNIQPFTGKLDQLRAVEKYAKSLPKLLGFNGSYYDNSLENVVDELFESHLKEKEAKRINKAIAKKCEDAIVFGTKNEQGYTYRMLKFKQPISTIMNMGEKGETFITAQVEKVKGMLKDGEIIFNNNLPKR